MSKVKSIIVPFIIGGTMISGVKYISTHVDNPPLAAILGGIPTGLISIYFLTSEKSIEYAHNYFYVTLSLLTSIMIFYLLHLHTTIISKDLILMISVIAWASMVGIRYIYLHDKK